MSDQKTNTTLPIIHRRDIIEQLIETVKHLPVGIAIGLLKEAQADILLCVETPIKDLPNYSITMQEIRANEDML